MAKKKLPAKMEATKWKKGQPSPNPNGRPPLTAEQRALRNITLDSYREIIQIVLSGSLSDLKAMAENPNTSALQVGIATSIMKAVKNGDYSVVERIAERIVGKIPDVINVNNNTNLNANVAAIDKESLKKAMFALDTDV